MKEGGNAERWRVGGQSVDNVAVDNAAVDSAADDAADDVASDRRSARGGWFGQRREAQAFWHGTIIIGIMGANG